MSAVSWTAELVGLLAGVLNIVSTFPPLWTALRRPCQGPRDWHQLASRMLQLLANLLWCAYALWQQLPSVIATTGFMSACLMLVIGHLWWRPAP